MSTSRRSVELPTEKSNGDQSPAGIEGDTPGRGERADEVPDRQIRYRDI
ncbi:MAG: hypothetical protein ACRD0V_09935 [Acidimicrobiales bacterium]